MNSSSKLIPEFTFGRNSLLSPATATPKQVILNFAKSGKYTQDASDISGWTVIINTVLLLYANIAFR